MVLGLVFEGKKANFSCESMSLVVSELVLEARKHV